MKNWLFIVIVLFIGWQQWADRSQPQADGVLASTSPEQQPLDDASPFDLNGYRITPVASFRLQGRVLAKEDYSLGREADLSPVDIAFGWGRMSDSTVLKQITISQGNRWYHWNTVAAPPIPLREIELSSANMHLIPADAAVEKTIKHLREGQLVKLDGQLVRVEAPDGWRWNSSLTREDVGGGSCELIFVRSLRVL